MKQALLTATIIFTCLQCFPQSVNEKSNDSDTNVYVIIQKLPVLEYKKYKDNGGLSFEKYLEDNFDKNCPECYGGVLVNFIVEKDGKIKYVTFTNAPNGGFCTDDFKNRLIKALQECPPWTPGYQNNVPKRVRFALPFHFNKSNK